MAIGDASFVDDIRRRTIELIGRYKKQDDVSLRDVRVTIEPERVLAETASSLGVEPEVFKVRRRNSVLRAVAARMLCKYAGLTQREAADVLQVSSSAAISKQQQRLSRELAENRKLRRQVGELEACLGTMTRAC